MASNDLEKLKKLAEEATPGPWELLERVKASQNPGVGHRQFGTLATVWQKSIPTIAGRVPRNADYIAAANPSTILALLSELEAAERERDLRKLNQEVGYETEKSDCSKALLAMCAAKKVTPAETYGSNSSWAISDLCRALREDSAALRTLREASQREVGWVIENGQLCLGEYCKNARWVTFTDPSAIRFRRKEDAEFVRNALELKKATVTEHVWLAAALAAEGSK